MAAFKPLPLFFSLCFLTTGFMLFPPAGAVSALASCLATGATALGIVAWTQGTRCAIELVVLEGRAANPRPRPGGRVVPGPHPPPRLVPPRRRLDRADSRDSGLLDRDCAHQPAGPGLPPGWRGTSRGPAGAPGPARRLRGGRLPLRMAPDPPAGLPRGRVPPGPRRPARPDPGSRRMARKGPAAALSDPGGPRGAGRAPLEAALDTGGVRGDVRMGPRHPSRPRPRCRRRTRQLSLPLGDAWPGGRLARLLPGGSHHQPILQGWQGRLRVPAPAPRRAADPGEQEHRLCDPPVRADRPLRPSPPLRVLVPRSPRARAPGPGGLGPGPLGVGHQRQLSLDPQPRQVARIEERTRGPMSRGTAASSRRC